MDEKEQRRLRVEAMMRERGMSSSNTTHSTFIEEEKKKIKAERERLEKERQKLFRETTVKSQFDNTLSKLGLKCDPPTAASGPKGITLGVRGEEEIGTNVPTAQEKVEKNKTTERKEAEQRAEHGGFENPLSGAEDKNTLGRDNSAQKHSTGIEGVESKVGEAKGASVKQDEGSDVQTSGEAKKQKSPAPKGKEGPRSGSSMLSVSDDPKSKCDFGLKSVPHTSRGNSDHNQSDKAKQRSKGGSKEEPLHSGSKEGKKGAGHSPTAKKKSGKKPKLFATIGKRTGKSDSVAVQREAAALALVSGTGKRSKKREPIPESLKKSSSSRRITPVQPASGGDQKKSGSGKGKSSRSGRFGRRSVVGRKQPQQPQRPGKKNSKNSDMVEDVVRWPCPHGIKCTSTDPQHFFEYQHTAHRQEEIEAIKKKPNKQLSTKDLLTSDAFGFNLAANQIQNSRKHQAASEIHSDKKHKKVGVSPSSPRSTSAVGGHAVLKKNATPSSVRTTKGEESSNTTARKDKGKDNSTVTGDGEESSPTTSVVDGGTAAMPARSETQPAPVRCIESFEEFSKKYVWYRDTLVGRGGFASVFKGKERATEKEVAIKVLSVAKMLAESQNPQTDKLNLEREIEISLAVRHSNVARCFGVYKEGDERVYFVFELLSGGSLADMLREQRKLPEVKAQTIIHHTLHGLRYLHDQHIAHRDIKLTNVMSKAQEQWWNVKIVDFGISCRCSERKDCLPGVEKRGDEKEVAEETSEDGTMNDIVGSLGFMAPEVIKGERYGVKVDMWSLGVVTFALLFGRLPILGSTEEEMVRLTQSGEYTIPDAPPITPAGKDFIRRLMAPPETRMDATEALNHRWIRSSTSVAGKEKLAESLVGKYIFKHAPRNNTTEVALSSPQQRNKQRDTNPPKDELREEVTLDFPKRRGSEAKDNKKLFGANTDSKAASGTAETASTSPKQRKELRQQQSEDASADAPDKSITDKHAQGEEAAASPSDSAGSFSASPDNQSQVKKADKVSDKDMPLGNKANNTGEGPDDPVYDTDPNGLEGTTTSQSNSENSEESDGEGFQRSSLDEAKVELACLAEEFIAFKQQNKEKTGGT